MDFESETLIFDAAQVTSRTNQSKPEPGAPAHTLAKDSAARAMLAFHTLQDPISGPVSPALDRKQAGMDLAHGAQVRRLTPLECERLQGFPDHYTAIPGAKDGPRYAAIGNSMAVPVMRWIGERIQAVSALPSRAAPEGEPRESP
jgi:DNA (cytosine-5)-methyltransferase 1